MTISKMILAATALSFGLSLTMPMGLTGTANAAAPREESYCTLIRETPDGKFRNDMQMGWSLYREQQKEGMIAFDDDVVGISCLRSPATLLPEDAESLSQGKSLYFSDPKGSGMTIIKYEAVDGQITWSAGSSVLTGKQEKAVKKAVEQVQKLM